jgi:hypothetical protein
MQLIEGKGWKRGSKAGCLSLKAQDRAKENLRKDQQRLFNRLVYKHLKKGVSLDKIKS